MQAQPKEAQRLMGQQLRRAQRRLEPDDWKPMPTVGRGVREIRVRDSDGTYRTMYVTSGRPPRIYVLAVFTKKTAKTPQRTIDLARKRYKAVTELIRTGE
ncbi:type II toxin-antitoxin system RelE/ParE family toxin [Tsukamurella pseudospumae]|nr:type II toxin-antitoxin system RelE/ParE family toxin [Tsukamurella pseudospumae]